MATPHHQPPDEPWSAPESGTVRDETSGNLPAAPQERAPQMPAHHSVGDPSQAGATENDDACFAGEER
jgi:hypothetical protein